MIYIPVPPWRRDFDCARDPLTARNALGITGTGGGGGAPTSAEYITSSADPTLTNERVLTNTATVTWDFTTPGQAKANATTSGGNVSNSGTPTVGQYAKWVTATTIQGVAPATVLSDIGAQPAGSYQPLDTELTALATTTSAADQVPYFTGSGTASTMTVTSAARTVLDDTSTSAMLTTLGGLSTTTAAATYQPLDSDLTALAGISGVQGDIIYRDASSWTRLAAGTSGQFLKTQGASANPVWATLAGGGNVSNTGTPVDNQVAVWTSSTVIEGDAKFTWNGTNLDVIPATDGVRLTGSAAVANVTATGGSTNVNLRYTTKGTGGHGFYTGGGQQLFIADQATAGLIWANGGDGATNLQMLGGSSGNVLTFGTCAAPTPAVGDNSTKVATTAWVKSQPTPACTVYTSGSGTYTTPSGARWLEVELVGGGGGGGSGAGNSGSTAGNSTFGGLTAAGGAGGGGSSAGGAPGTASGGTVNASGGYGHAGTVSNTSLWIGIGGNGGASFFGGGGAGGLTTGNAGLAPGSGGGGGGSLSSGVTFAGAGGGSGGYCSTVISSPAATYSYAVGAAGAGAAGTASVYAGAAGAAGIIIVTAYFSETQTWL